MKEAFGQMAGKKTSERDLRRRSFRGVEVGVHGRVVVHFKLPVNLQPLASGEQIGQQFGQRGGKVVMLLVKDRQPGVGLVAVLLVGVGAVGLFLHVVESQRENRQPVDHAARSLRVQADAGDRPDTELAQLGDQSVVEFLDEIVPLLVEFVDVPFDLGDVLVAYILAPGDVFFVPEPVVSLVLVANQAEEPFIGVFDFLAVPALDRRAMELCNGMDVDHDFLA